MLSDNPHKNSKLFKRLKVIMEESGPRKIRWMTYQNHAGSPVKLGTSPMKSKKNLTRFTYETAAFEGWRLSISRAGSSFTRYFPDKKLGGPKQSLAVAEKALAEVKAIIEGSKRVDGKLPAATVKKVEKFLMDAVV